MTDTIPSHISTFFTTEITLLQSDMLRKAIFLVVKSTKRHSSKKRSPQKGFMTDLKLTTLSRKRMKSLVKMQ